MSESVITLIFFVLSAIACACVYIAFSYRYDGYDDTPADYTVGLEHDPGHLWYLSIEAPDGAVWWSAHLGPREAQFVARRKIRRHRRKGTFESGESGQYIVSTENYKFRKAED